jgi:hypothetical protein
MQASHTKIIKKTSYIKQQLSPKMKKTKQKQKQKQYLVIAMRSLFLPLLRRFKPAEPVVEKSVIL